VSDVDKAGDLFSRNFPDGVVGFLGDVLTPEAFIAVRERTARSGTAARNVVALGLALVRQSQAATREERTDSLGRLLGTSSIAGAALGGLQFELLDLRGWEFRNCDLSGATFRFCDLRECGFAGSHSDAARLEDCIVAEPVLHEKRQRVLDVLREHIRFFEAGPAEGQWHSKVAEEGVQKDRRYRPEVIRALCTVGVLTRTRGAGGESFLELERKDDFEQFRRSGELSDRLSQAVDSLVRRSGF